MSIPRIVSAMEYIDDDLVSGAVNAISYIADPTLDEILQLDQKARAYVERHK